MKTIRFERQGSIGRIVLANPPYNRLDLQFSHCLRDAIHEASGSDIRALVISSEGEYFSFGGEVREWPGKDIDWFRTFVAEVNASYRALEILRVPTVAAVRGVAFGGGFELALSCDFLIAADNAVFRCVEVTTGFIPIAGALQRLAERVGRSRASRFAMLMGGRIGANLGVLPAPMLDDFSILEAKQVEGDHRPREAAQAFVLRMKHDDVAIHERAIDRDVCGRGTGDLGCECRQAG